MTKVIDWSGARQVPPLPLEKLGRTIVKGFETLGWHWWPSATAILTRPYDGRNACNNCGPCDIGCYQGAKASYALARPGRPGGLGQSPVDTC